MGSHSLMWVVDIRLRSLAMQVVEKVPLYVPVGLLCLGVAGAFVWFLVAASLLHLRVSSRRFLGCRGAFCFAQCPAELVRFFGFRFAAGW
eukprot:g8337.t1